MTFRHLRIFITVVDCHSMSQAAKVLFISQPSVSQAIKELEDYYGVKLFERLSKKLFITESGEKLLKYARHLVSTFEEMEVELMNAGQYVNLRVGATITVGTCILAPLVQTFEMDYEEVSIQTIVNNTNVIEKMLLNSQLDVAIIEGEITHHDLIKTPIYQDKLVLVVGKTHPLYVRDKIKIEELAHLDLIGREEGSGARGLFDALLAKHQIEMNRKWSSTNTEAMKSAVIQGQGVAVFSTLMIEEEVKAKKLKVIELQDIEIYRAFCLVHHKNKFISPNLHKFMEYIKLSG